ncbi:general secretion pathway protein I [Pseudomonas sp. NFACC09-4]|uniref:type II secretion system minor pseudopilin GspI n=1 Tax=Pseudomonas TaxID=286 RepID=UPI000908E0F5|nr:MULTISPECIES: type II secretion system minor pseudopilin GspI [Pseudomonas]MDT8905563.1 type II secretion system minor pseudopilin GspI [Pseudomonas prosekii]NHN68479.1 type II secretion system minor pseudopilin GspI [Pseudomonas fluorescens]ROO39584.1 type II secretion system protein GspI [Pseudomonas sp. AF76]SFW45187.1 general secretion pathway protein I [Pseudomonas sp. NFACC09-4]SFX67109.1 general secretion pathway protein I [Pseudomonas sp. NFACC49-2]
MCRPAPQAGFTLIEVLVALAIIAVAMSAAVRVAAVMTQGNGLLRDKSIALLAARTQLAQLRLDARFTPGTRVSDCDQGRLLLRCEQSLRPAENGRMLRVELSVSDRSREAPPLARLETLVVREK